MRGGYEVRTALHGCDDVCSDGRNGEVERVDLVLHDIADAVTAFEPDSTTVALLDASSSVDEVARVC